MNTKQPQEILNKHKLWLDGKEGGERADLSSANLNDASLRDADLSHANLSDANLSDASLSEANLADVRGLFPICPEGEFTAFKRVANGIILQLRIPADALRVNKPGSRKCRASKAYVVAAFNFQREPVPGTEFRTANIHGADPAFMYRIGEYAVPANSFSADIREECEPGIHFYLTFDEAREN